MTSYLPSGVLIENGKYQLVKPLGTGTHAEVFVGTDTETKETVAIKLESWDRASLFLAHEYQMYQIIQGEIGFPTAKLFCQEQRHNIMVVDLLGPSLDSIFQKCGNKFSLKTVVMLANQLFERVEYLHEKGLIHRSIKPENFAVGLDNPSLIYMIDFGNARRYKTDKGKHIKFKIYEDLGLSNCHSRHQSLGVLQRMERSRRDDLESLGYMLIYFLRGSLPWDSVMDDPVALKEVKMGTTIETLCDGCPDEFFEYMTYVKNLEFSEDPVYVKIRRLWKGLADRFGIELDGKFDWVQESKPAANLHNGTSNNNGVKWPKEISLVH